MWSLNRGETESRKDGGGVGGVRWMEGGKECKERAKVNRAADSRVGRGADKTAVCLSREKMCQTLPKEINDAFCLQQGRKLCNMTV